MRVMESNLNELATACHEYAKSHGFYKGGFNIGEKLMLVVTELSEAMEAWRTGKTTAATPSPGLIKGLERRDPLAIMQFKEDYKDTFQDEIADAVIRLFDLCGKLKIDIDASVLAKMAYNNTRPYQHGGKSC